MQFLYHSCSRVPELAFSILGPLSSFSKCIKSSAHCLSAQCKEFPLYLYPHTWNPTHRIIQPHLSIPHTRYNLFLSHNCVFTTPMHIRAHYTSPSATYTPSLSTKSTRIHTRHQPKHHIPPHLLLPQPPLDPNPQLEIPPRPHRILDPSFTATLHDPVPRLDMRPGPVLLSETDHALEPYRLADAAARRCGTQGGDVAVVRA